MGLGIAVALERERDWDERTHGFDLFCVVVGLIMRCCDTRRFE